MHVSYKKNKNLSSYIKKKSFSCLPRSKSQTHKPNLIKIHSERHPDYVHVSSSLLFPLIYFPHTHSVGFYFNIFIKKNCNWKLHLLGVPSRINIIPMIYGFGTMNKHWQSADFVQKRLGTHEHLFCYGPECWYISQQQLCIHVYY